MASLVKLRKFISPLTSKNTGLFYNIVRPKVYTNDDWKPGPYPKTEEERKKAAEKYGLTPEEYEPYPDDGSGLGDYPKLPLIGRAAKGYDIPWSETAFRRMLHEPLHKHVNIIQEDRYDAGLGQYIGVSGKTAHLMFFGSILGLMGLMLLFETDKMHHPVMEKQIPKPGVVHYTFEPAR